MLALTLLQVSECCNLNKQEKFLEDNEMRFLRDIASHRRTGHKNKGRTRRKVIGFHSGVVEVYSLVGYDASSLGNRFPTFRG